MAVSGICPQTTANYPPYMYILYTPYPLPPIYLPYILYTLCRLSLSFPLRIYSPLYTVYSYIYTLLTIYYIELILSSPLVYHLPRSHVFTFIHYRVYTLLYTTILLIVLYTILPRLRFTLMFMFVCSSCR